MLDNSDNIYTSLANLYSAKIMYLENELDQSYLYLDHIILNSDDIDIVDIAKYRKNLGKCSKKQENIGNHCKK